MFPKCFPYWIVDGQKISNSPGVNNVQGVAYTGRGYLLPCCWCDNHRFDDEFAKLNFFDPALKVENVQDIEQEIILSSVWKEFRKNLIEGNLEKIPRICKEKCRELPK